MVRDRDWHGRFLPERNLDPTGRVCRKCGEFKPWTCFGAAARGYNGKQSRCKACLSAAQIARNRSDPAKRNAQRRAWLDKNQEKMAQMRAAWRKQNPGRVAELARRRRARKKGARDHTLGHTEAEWRDLLLHCGGRCARCKKKRSLTRDHIIPLSKGGGDEITNIQPLCQPCNSRKHNKLLYLI